MAVKPKLPEGKGQSYKGEMENYEQEKFAKPFEEVDSGVGNMDKIYDDIGEKSGFQGNTDSYIVKKGMVFGEAAKLNIMPPGMDISDQPYRDIRDMPMRLYTGGVNYPEDGAFVSRDVKEDYPSKGKLA